MPLAHRNSSHAGHQRGHFRKLRATLFPFWLETRLWIANCETIQLKKTTWCWQQSHIHALLTWRYVPLVVHPQRHFLEGENMHVLTEYGLWHIAKRETMRWKKLHDIDSNLTSTPCSRRDISHAWDIREDVLGRARPCSCWGSLRSGAWKRAKARL